MEFPDGVTKRLDDATGWDDQPVSHSTWVNNVRTLVAPYNATYDDDDIFHFESEGDYAMFLLRWA